VKIQCITNFSVIDEKKLIFLVNNDVGLSTSLDGPEEIHNKNRICLNLNSYKKTIHWIKKAFNYCSIREIQLTQQGKKGLLISKPGAIATITKDVLTKPKELVDLYVNYGFSNVALRPLTQIGFARNSWKKLSYSCDEFMDFYKTTVDYILHLNIKKKIFFAENIAKIKLQRILNPSDPGFTDDRNPCGGGIGQIAYDFNGDIYTCDEGRMIGREGDKIFKMGTVGKNNWEDLINSTACKSLCSVSCTDCSPGLDNHVYKPYIGLCPVKAYAETGQMQPNIFEMDYYKIQIKILDYLFEKIKDPQILKIFQEWIK